MRTSAFDLLWLKHITIYIYYLEREGEREIHNHTISKLLESDSETETDSKTQRHFALVGLCNMFYTSVIMFQKIFGQYI